MLNHPQLLAKISLIQPNYTHLRTDLAYKVNGYAFVGIVLLVIHSHAIRPAQSEQRNPTFNPPVRCA